MYLLVAASASGYASHEISLSDGIPYGRPNLMLHPIREVSGTVTDPQGRNVAGAKVRGRRVGQARHIHLDQYRESVTECDVSFTIRVPGRLGAAKYTSHRRLVLSISGVAAQSSSLAASLA